MSKINVAEVLAKVGVDLSTMPAGDKPSKNGTKPPAAPVPIVPGAVIDGEALDVKLTETGNAKEFERRFAGRVFYVVGRGWMVWDGQRFAEDIGAGGVTRMMREIAYDWYARGAEAGREGRKNEADMMMRFAKISLSNKSLNASLAQAEKQEGLLATVGQFDLDPMKLNVRNGIIDLRTGKLLPHDPAERMTKLVPVDYNPSATAPTWHKFMNDVFMGRRDVIDFFRRWLGYGLTGVTKDQKYVIAWGEGGNGKSTLYGTLEKIMGDYAMKLDASALTAKREKSDVNTGIAQIPGARLVVCTEWHDTSRPDETMLKDLTGGDTIRTRTLYKEPFEFTPACKLNIFGNERPDIRGTDFATWRRVLLVPFEATFTGEAKDENMPVKLLAEAAGILANLVRGCLEWQQAGLNPPADVAEATAKYRAEQDELERFFDEFCERAPQARVNTEALWNAYKNKFGGTHDTQNKFGRAMKKKGYESRPSSASGLRQYHGIKLLDAGQAMPEME
jgi:putative DNA primase/helicase